MVMARLVDTILRINPFKKIDYFSQILIYIKKVLSRVGTDEGVDCMQSRERESFMVKKCSLSGLGWSITIVKIHQIRT